MKLLTTFLACTFALFSTVIFAQNWTPIHIDDVYHYELVGDTMSYDSINTDIGYFRNNSPVDATIWIDSMEVAAGQTTYHFNKIVTRCDTCTTIPYEEPFYLRNQPQFLLNQMIAFDNGTYTLVGENEWHIQPEAIVGDTWIFDSMNGIDAEVVDVFEGEVLGISDSLKYVALSNGDTMLLSKMHGIIEFPDLQNAMYQNLIGIQTRDLGFRIPGFEEMYNFNVGDIFQYGYGAGGIQGGFYGKAKITVLDKEDYEDSIVYAIRRIDYKLSYIYFGPYYDQITDGEWMSDDTTTHTFHKSDIADIYPGQLFGADRYCSYGQPQNDIWDGSHVGCLEPQQEEMHELNQLFYGQNDEGKWVKFMASNDWVPVQMYSNLQIVPNMNSDILELGVCFEPYYRVWEEGLGETVLQHWCFEGGYGRSLSGYIIDGDTTGTITSDSVLLITNLEEIISDETAIITLHPNPATDQIYFNIQFPKAIRELEVLVYDSVGKVLKNSNLEMQSSGSLNVSQLPPGVYLISFRTEYGVLSRRFIKN